MVPDSRNQLTLILALRRTLDTKARPASARATRATSTPCRVGLFIAFCAWSASWQVADVASGKRCEKGGTSNQQFEVFRPLVQAGEPVRREEKVKVRFRHHLRRWSAPYPLRSIEDFCAGTPKLVAGPDGRDSRRPWAALSWICQNVCLSVD